MQLIIFFDQYGIKCIINNSLLPLPPLPQVSDGKHPPRYTMFTIKMSPLTLTVAKRSVVSVRQTADVSVLATGHAFLSKLAPIGTFS